MKLPPAFSTPKKINVVIETPKGSRNKYTYDPEGGFFRLKRILPEGTLFPLDFGFVPHTRAEDGDPLDALVMMEFPSFPGCVVECRCIGVIEVSQRENGKKAGAAFRNDRLVAVAGESRVFSDLKTIGDLNPNLVGEIIHFFGYYNEMAGRKFRFLGLKGRREALALIQKHLE